MKKILVCLDSSPRAADVLGAAAGLARRFDARLVLFRAYAIPVELPTEAYSVPPGDVGRLLERDARRSLEQAARAVAPALVAALRVDIGVPAQAICAAARELDVDLIVIGAHGFGGLDRVLGTTAAKVVNHADRAVLVVRAAERLA